MRAELFSTDFIVSIILFLSIVVIVGFYYGNLQNDIYQQYVRDDMYRKAINAADLLVVSSGSPKYWDATNVEVIGLNDEGKINLTKFSELKNLDHQTVRQMMGTGIYNLNISLKDETGNFIKEDDIVYTFGLPLTNAKNIISIKRLAIADLETENKKVIVEVILWA